MMIAIFRMPQMVFFLPTFYEFQPAATNLVEVLLLYLGWLMALECSIRKWYFPNVYAGGRRARIKLEESQAGSASIGGFSTVERLQENEEKISTENIVKSARKKSKPEQKDAEVENEGRTSKEKATKCKKSENSQDMEERISTEVSLKSAKKKLKGEKPTAEGALSPLTPSHKDLQVHVSENEETILKENVTKSGKKSKREHSTSEPELSSPKPMQPESMSSEKKSRKHKKSKTEGSHQ